MKSRIDSLQEEYIKILLDTDVHHNDIQWVTNAACLSHQVIRKMVHLGGRHSVVDNAIETYKLALLCDGYFTAADLASLLSNHYGQIDYDQSLRRLWFKRYRECIDQYLIEQEARNEMSNLTEIIQSGKSTEIVLSGIEDIMTVLSRNKTTARSYIYWHSWYIANIFYHEISGDYEGQLEVATTAYRYFQSLPLNHSEAEAAMASRMVHANNLMHRYDEALTLLKVLPEENRTNRDLLALRLSRSLMTAGNIARALELLESIQSHKLAITRVYLYRSYCLGEFLGDGTGDENNMNTAYLILDLYCGCRAGKFRQYNYEFLQEYISAHDLSETREGVVIEILSLLRFKNKKMDKIKELLKKLSQVKCKSTEAEVLRFETIVTELL